MSNNCGQSMVCAFLHSERCTLHGRELDTNNVACEVTQVLDGGETYFVDPIEGDWSLYVGDMSCGQKSQHLWKPYLTNCNNYKVVTPSMRLASSNFSRIAKWCSTTPPIQCKTKLTIKSPNFYT